VIEKLTGAKVVAFLSQAHVDPDITMEIFFVDGHSEASAHSNSSNPNRHVAPGTDAGDVTQADFHHRGSR